MKKRNIEVTNLSLSDSFWWLGDWLSWSQWYAFKIGKDKGNQARPAELCGQAVLGRLSPH